jgi:hypothetical protein
MTITTLPELDAVAQRRADELNAARPLDTEGQPVGDAVTASSVLTDNVNAILLSWQQAQDAADRAVLASNERLLALGKLAAAHPEKIDAIEAAVNNVIQS